MIIYRRFCIILLLFYCIYFYEAFHKECFCNEVDGHNKKCLNRVMLKASYSKSFYDDCRHVEVSSSIFCILSAI